MVFTLLVASLFSTITVDDLHSHYGEIFRTGNRNAASHMWASWILAQAHQLSSADLERLFSGFCPVSGSPVNPSEYNTYHYKLRSLVPGAEHASGFMHHCCAPCVCDTHDMIRADTKTVSLASGASATLTFAVIGDPCKRASTLERTFTDPFSGSETTLGATAPEVQCDANGKLEDGARGEVRRQGQRQAQYGARGEVRRQRQAQYGARGAVRRQRQAQDGAKGAVRRQRQAQGCNIQRSFGRHHWPPRRGTGAEHARTFRAHTRPCHHCGTPLWEVRRSFHRFQARALAR